MKKIISVFIASIFIFTLPIFAEAPASAPILTPDIQKNFDKGLSAAQQKDYDLAIRYFNDVFESAPLYPDVYFNLGLAHANAGHELVAIAWLKAYLQAEPKASNKRDIEKAITDQEVAAESEGRKVIEQAEQAALALPEDGSGYSARASALSSISSALSSTGDMEGGIKFAEKNQLKTAFGYKVDALYSYISALTSDKKNEQALELIKQIPDDRKQMCLEPILSSYQYAGNLDKAMQVFRMLPKPGESYHTQSLAEAFANNGDWNEAEVITEKISEPGRKFETYLLLAKAARAKKNSSKSAEMILKAENFKPMKNEDNADQVLKLAEAYLDSGDNSKAVKMLDSYPTKPDTNPYVLNLRAAIYAKAGEFGKAEQTFSTIVKPDDKNWAARGMIDGFVAKKDLKRAKAYLQYLNTSAFFPFDIGGGYANVAWALIQDGKESEGRKLIKDIPNTSKYNQEDYMYRDLASRAAKAGNYKFAYEFLDKLPQDNDWKGGAVGSVAEALINAKRNDEAIALLEKNLNMKFYTGNEPLFNFWFRIVDRLEDEKKHEEAILVLDKTANAAVGRRDIETLNRAAEYYKKFNDREHEAQVREWANDLKWVALAKEFEKARTFDPSAVYKQFQKSEYGQYIPSDMAYFGIEYFKALKKIEETEKQ